MGYYVPGPNHGKADHIVKNHGGQVVAKPAKFADIPADKALICVMNNGPFEAAEICRPTLRISGDNAGSGW